METTISSSVTFLQKIKNYIIAHKIMSIIVVLLVLYAGYFIYGKLTSTAGDTRYVLSAVKKGVIVSSIDGSGQVSASNQIDLKPKVSGVITYIGVKAGDFVSQGEVLFSIDNTNAQKSVRDAEINLQNQKLSLEKLKIQDSNDNLNSDLTQAYNDGFNAVASVFVDMPSIVTGLGNLLSSEKFSDNAARGSGDTAIAYRYTAEKSYEDVKTVFEKNRTDFKLLDYNSSKTQIESIVDETYQTTQQLSTALKNFLNFVDYLSENTGRTADFSSTQSTVSSYINTINGHSSALFSAQTTIKSKKDAFLNTNLDIQSAELSITQKENALLDAQNTLADYSITAPFSGTIASVPVQTGDQASSGTILSTLVTTKQIAEISLNEVDVAKIKLGNKVTLTFDSFPDLSISGVVEEINSIGTVSQGVVTYTVKISFDTQDDRIRPGMSVSAAIITDMKQGVLTVPNSAVKSDSSGNYVEMFDTTLPPPASGTQGSISILPPNKVSVEIGISNTSETEIISGIKEGDEVVTKTILPTTTKTTTTPSLLSGASGGGNRGGTTGGAVRLPTTTGR